jgi:hypothetical protein|tara:strand:+ start:16034 stop:18583 length:2550 start_codon:yes stop_codon:yes gene_type:complete
MRLIFQVLFISSIFSQQKIDLPMQFAGINYDLSIPKPEDVIGHKIGDRHTRTSQIVDYYESIASVSDRVDLDDHARSHEGRRLIHAIVTHPDNHKNLENIRIENVKISDMPNQMKNKNLDKMPLVAYLGFSIHGDEASGAEAAVLLLHHLAAGQGDEIDQILRNTIIIIDPMFNPDGRDRFANWANGNRGIVPTTDTQDREHNQPWPRGRTNHYLFDLNRDWMPVTQPESQGRVKLFHHWRPQFLLDVHEMGRNSTFFFQPGIKSRTNPNTPKEGVELTYKIAPFFAKRLDDIQSMYYSEQSYDDFYYGKGSTYGDIHGSVGILFEQGSSRALETESNQGKLTYAFTVRNQYMATLGAIDGLVALRKEFLRYQRDFYATSSAVATKNKIKGYLINLKENRTRVQMLVKTLQSHRVDAYTLKKPITVKGKRFNKGEAVIIPTNQPQTRFIAGVMEKVTAFEDSLFYDVSAWTLPLAFGVDYYEVKQKPDAFLGAKLKAMNLDGGELVGGKATSAYLMPWNRYFNPKSLYSILDSGILPRITTAPFSAEVAGKSMQFKRGTIVIPVVQRDADARITAAELHRLMEKLVSEDHVQIYATNSSSTPSGPDLGGAFQGVLKKPHVALLSGAGTSAYGSGEIWHLIDNRMNIPVSRLNAENLNRNKLSKYNTIIFPDGNYSKLDSTDVNHLKEWVSSGGTLISVQSGSKWIVDNNVIDEELVENQKLALDIPYDQVRLVTGAQRIGGAIFNINIDNTHPLGYGYRNKHPVFRRGYTFFKLSESAAANVGRYTNKPLLSGYVSEEKLAGIKDTASIIAKKQGSGHVVMFADNPAFRAFWYGTNGLLLNAIFFGHIF